MLNCFVRRPIKIGVEFGGQLGTLTLEFGSAVANLDILNFEYIKINFFNSFAIVYFWFPAVG